MNRPKKQTIKLVVLGCFIGLICTSAEAVNSTLWGQSGERWSPASRLPEFSHAGYMGSDAPIPSPPVVTNVKNFGAVGDGVTDDSQAFLNAIAATHNGALFIPAGRYKIRKQLKVTESNVVIRGAGQSATTLYFPISLTAAAGPGQSSAPGGSWSWSGGFFQIDGNNRGTRLATVTTLASRGSRTLTLSRTTGMSVGQRIRVVAKNTDDSWLRYLFNNQYAAPALLHGTKAFDFPCKITAIQGNTITIDRPLRTDVRTAWTPEIDSDLPSLQNVGFEDFTMEFPEQPYAGHHLEPGFNGFDMREVENCWIRRIHLINCDSGAFVHESTWFCTVQTIRFSAGPNRFVTGYDYVPDHPFPIAGHHGLLAQSYAADNLFTDFRFDVRFIHEIAVDNQSTGNVFSEGSGVDVVLDHHRNAPYANLFTDIDVGTGVRMWEAGGDDEDGPEAGSWETFWNIRSDRFFGWPDKWDYAPVYINLVGITTNVRSATPAGTGWLEAIDPDSLVPPNLYLAQRAFRDQVSTELPSPTLDLPGRIPVNGTLSADYPPSMGQVGFEWTLTPAAQDAALGSGPGSALRASASAASFRTTGTKAQLGSYNLLPGVYRVTVQAFDSLGRVSPMAQASITLVSQDLAAAKVFPNPWRSDRHSDKPVTFDLLPLGSTVELFTVSGHFIRKLVNAAGTITWDLRNDSGDKVASGIYIYLLKTPTDQMARGKFVVIR